MRLLFRLALLFAAAAHLGGCYVMHAARGQWEVMSRRVPIPEVIADPGTEPRVRSQLEAVLEMRRFAVEELGLPDNDSYRTYADLKRPYVVWNVVATPAFEVEPKRWCFPFAGCVTYRGYFSEARARRFADRLRRRGYDVSVAGVPAYSTLGHFADPVLNTMMHWSEARLAGILFHELSHQLIYVPGDSLFNEAFATVVEEEGVRRWLVQEGRGHELEDFLEYRRRFEQFAQLVASTRERLRTLYAREVPVEQMRRDKWAEFAALRRQYADLRSSWGGRGEFDGWFARELNNAHLAAIATYQQCVPGLEALLAQEEGDLGRFYARVRELAALDPATRHRLVCQKQR